VVLRGVCFLVRIALVTIIIILGVGAES